MNELALFAGAGGGILGGHLLGRRIVCAVERDAYAAAVLAQRQNDGCLPPFPIWSDVETFDGRPWRGLVDVVSGGFPCQDISVAGGGAGIEGARSGKWKDMARIIGEVRPIRVELENSPFLVGRGLAVVLGDLASMGYDAEWFCLSASDLGAPHQRDRIWLVAHPSGQGLQKPKFKTIQRAWWRQEGGAATQCGRWPAEPGVGRVANGVAARVDRLKALGNGQVPRVAAAAFSMLAGE